MSPQIHQDPNFYAHNSLSGTSHNPFAGIRGQLVFTPLCSAERPLALEHWLETHV